MSKFIYLLAVLFGLSACTSKDSVKNLLKNNPDILTEAIEANPEKVMAALNNAAHKAQAGAAKQREEDDAKALEESFEKPLQPEIKDADVLYGAKDAPLTLVIYSDFECPYCRRGYQNEKELMERYKGKIRVVFKNLPLPMHAHAMIAAKFFEAVRLQSSEKAAKFHDRIFSKQEDLQKGESFLKSVAKDVGADMGKLSHDLDSDAVKSRIATDSQEAAKFGMEGTPGYVLNGVPVRGAYPTDYFVGIIEKLEKKGKVKL